MEPVFESNWLIVGLGNPGLQYERTRHNLGFMVIDLLARDLETQVKREECRSLVGRAEIEGDPAELVKPQTYMNLSGEAVSCLLKKPERSVERLLVISDDMALPFGKIRIRPKGTHGGHNGLRSIIDRTGSNDFARVRIGIMPEHPVANTRDFVLQNFGKGETAQLDDLLRTCADAVRSVITDGVEKAMARWN